MTMEVYGSTSPLQAVAEHWTYGWVGALPLASLWMHIRTGATKSLITLHHHILPSNSLSHNLKSLNITLQFLPPPSTHSYHYPLSSTSRPSPPPVSNIPIYPAPPDSWQISEHNLAVSLQYGWQWTSHRKIYPHTHCSAAGWLQHINPSPSRL